MIDAFKSLLGITEITSYSDMFFCIMCMVVILFTVTSFLQFVCSLFRGNNR